MGTRISSIWAAVSVKSRYFPYIFQVDQQRDEAYFEQYAWRDFFPAWPSNISPSYFDDADFQCRLRKIASEGVPTENLYGCDLRPEFFDLGYRLFRDKETLKSKFLVADIFDPESTLTSLYGKVDIIYAGSFLHLFGYAKQIEVCKQIVKLLKDKKNSMLLGRQVGNLEAGEKTHDTNKEGSMFR